MNTHSVWRSTFATLILIVYTTLAFYWLLTVAVPWLTHWGGVPWSFGPVNS